MLITFAAVTSTLRWPVANQAAWFMGFSRLPFPSPGDLPDPGIESGFPPFRQMLYRLSQTGKEGKLVLGMLIP